MPPNPMLLLALRGVNDRQTQVRNEQQAIEAQDRQLGAQMEQQMPQVYGQQLQRQSVVDELANRYKIEQENRASEEMRAAEKLRQEMALENVRQTGETTRLGTREAGEDRRQGAGFGHAEKMLGREQSFVGGENRLDRQLKRDLQTEHNALAEKQFNVGSGRIFSSVLHETRMGMDRELQMVKEYGKQKAEMRQKFGDIMARGGKATIQAIDSLSQQAAQNPDLLDKYASGEGLPLDMKANIAQVQQYFTAAKRERDAARNALVYREKYDTLLKANNATEDAVSSHGSSWSQSRSAPVGAAPGVVDISAFDPSN